MAKPEGIAFQGYTKLSEPSHQNLPTHALSPADRSCRRRRILLIGALAGISLFGVHYCPNHHATWSRGPFARPDVPELGILSTSRNPAYLVEASHGAVASENEVCSQVGVDVIKDGGNGVDAAIASTLCIGVQNMFSAGIGGGGFMTVRVPSAADSDKFEVWTIDFREVAPALANSTMYVGKPREASRFGGLSVAVPTELRALGEAHKRWGKLSWARLVQPSADLAYESRVGKELGKRIPWYPDLMLSNPDWSAIFAPEGYMLREGDILRNRNLSRTLQTVADEGPEAFYSGPIADALINKIRATGGIVTTGDFANNTVKVSRALQGSFMGHKVYVPGAPTSGPVLLHMLKLAERFGLSDAMDEYDVKERGRRVHLIVESHKFGFAARTRMCDPEFNDQRDIINEIPTSKYADLIAKNVTEDRTHEAEYYQPVYDLPTNHGTSHVSAYTADGVAASITSSVNLIFGSQVLDPVTGVILNDVMDDFSTPGIPNAFGLWPSPYNYPAPFKRSLSSMAPTIIEDPDGQFLMTIGGSGGSRIFGSVFQAILNSFRGFDISTSIEAGRVHDQLFPAFLDADDAIGEDMIAELRARGHNVTVTSVNGVKAVVNAVVRDGRRIYAASDSRKNGIAAGW